MLSLQFVFIVTVTLTTASGIAATGIAVFGDTRRNLGQRAVAEKVRAHRCRGDRVAVGIALIFYRWPADAEFMTKLRSHLADFVSAYNFGRRPSVAAVKASSGIEERTVTIDRKIGAIFMLSSC